MTISSLFDQLSILMMVLGAICGSIGLLKLYAKWTKGYGKDMEISIIFWLVGGVLLSIIPSICKMFYGL